jgi:hypothetical protein
LSIAEPILLSIESLRTQIVAYEKIIEETAAAIIRLAQERGRKPASEGGVGQPI